ncbi:protein trichome birefringence-like 5 [Magnolia sinica]|uniref:protein trichome birefringence-like 5 n=1 Tax=Magnolia sinica TaxID=86752 RepID=UPI002657FC9F|nr:protein trichome birefringence-like 5 [Magnolia sinica]
MAVSSSQRTHYSIVITSFFFFFLLSLVYFSKRSLEPSISFYRHPWPESLSFSSNIPTPTPTPTTTDLSIPPSKHPQPISTIQLPSLPLNQPPDPLPNPIQPAVAPAEDDNPLPETVNREEKQCDLYIGNWVKDDEYPLYRPSSCPYVDEAFNCKDNGRPDVDYTKWRWKPDGCDLPRFNATDFLERLRGRRLLLVGDSMNRNQFESMLCLLREALPNKSRMYETRGNKITKGRGYFIFKFKDYDCTVEFCRSHFLVKEGIRLNSKGQSNPTLLIDRIDKTYSRWKRADILVFNTGHWWTHGKTARGKNYYQEGNYIYPQFDATEAFRRAMKTWGKWIDGHMNPKKKLVFYRGYSAAHFRGGDWDSGGTCKGETEPIASASGAFIDTHPLKMKIVEEVIREMRFPVILLNVTRLTNFRKDGHPSIYRKTATEGRKLSTRRQDCSHWCLPGVPDAWNELIYASLVMKQTPSLRSKR